jgi:hypothetical protein
MTFVVRTRPSQFSDEPLPEGLTQAACVDVHDLGMQIGLKGVEVHKVRLVFETPLRDSKGQEMRVSTWPYTVSLGKTANLRKHLERWRGRPFTAQELAGFDLDSVIGAPAMLNIVRREKDGKTYSNIDGIFKDTNPTKYKPTGTYVRAPRQAVKETEPEREPGYDDNFEDEPVPF